MITTVFDDSDKARVFDAILDLSPFNFTSKELARQASVSHRKVKRMLPKLVEWGVLREIVSDDYQVRSDSRYIRIFSIFAAALSLVEGSDDYDIEKVSQAIDEVVDNRATSEPPASADPATLLQQLSAIPTPGVDIHARIRQRDGKLHMTTDVWGESVPDGQRKSMEFAVATALAAPLKGMKLIGYTTSEGIDVLDGARAGSESPPTPCPKCESDDTKRRLCFACDPEDSEPHLPTNEGCEPCDHGWHDAVDESCPNCGGPRSSPLCDCHAGKPHEPDAHTEGMVEPCAATDEKGIPFHRLASEPQCLDGCNVFSGTHDPDCPASIHQSTPESGGKTIEEQLDFERAMVEYYEEENTKLKKTKVGEVIGLLELVAGWDLNDHHDPMGELNKVTEKIHKFLARDDRTSSEPAPIDDDDELQAAKVLLKTVGEDLAGFEYTQGFTDDTMALAKSAIDFSERLASEPTSIQQQMNEMYPRLIEELEARVGSLYVHQTEKGPYDNEMERSNRLIADAKNVLKRSDSGPADDQEEP